MRKRTIEFECPFCHNTFRLLKDTLLMRSMIQGEYRRLKENTFFLHQCSLCHQIFPLQYPLIYRDFEKGFSVILSERNEIENLPEGKNIIAHNAKDFLVAFHCLDAQVEIKEVLKIRNWLKKTQEELIELVEILMPSKVLVFETKEKRQILVQLK